jgi:hypothetical protein
MRCLPTALLLPALLLALHPGPAVADDAPRSRPKNGLGLQSGPTTERIVTDTGSYVFAVVMPVGGGRYVTEAELGIDPADPMDYPLIWQKVGGDQGFVVLTIGTLEASVPIDDLIFRELHKEVAAATYAQFPNKGVEAEQLEPAVEGGLEWTLSTAASPDGSMEIARFCTYSGNRFYGLFFFGGAGSTADEKTRAQMQRIVDSFEVLQAAPPV